LEPYVKYLAAINTREMAIRKPELEVAARIGITPEAYKILRRLKKVKKQSLIKIVSDLIYGRTATQRTKRKGVTTLM
jgi:hypothetical protein